SVDPRLLTESPSQPQYSPLRGLAPAPRPEQCRCPNPRCNCNSGWSPGPARLGVRGSVCLAICWWHYSLLLPPLLKPTLQKCSSPRAAQELSMRPPGFSNFLLLASSLLFAGLSAVPQSFSPSLR
ncbi:hypothetical protein P7K49_000210, partial [Saguinus oedipus]